MKPQDVPIILGMSDEDVQPVEKPTPTSDLGRVKAPAPIYIAESDLQSRIDKSAKVSLADGMTVIGDISSYADISDVPLRVACHCVKFDLSINDDRQRYADLFGKAGDACGHLDIVWEKQIVSEDKLIIYVTYTETLRVSDD